MSNINKASDKKAVLAYSGGLDTSVMIAWLKEHYGLDTVAVLVDAGRPGTQDAGAQAEELKEKALAIGAVEAVVIDGSREFAEDFVLPALAANALYEGKYPLVSALSRPFICRALVKEARRHGAGTVVHGCTAKGNDQVRFDLGIRALDPTLKILAPAREWGMTREQAFEYAAARSIPVPLKKETPYSIDENLWGRTVECGPLEDPWQEPPEDAFEVTAPAAETPDEALYIEVEFAGGRPVALNGNKKEFTEIVAELDRQGGGHGFGRVDIIENRLVGIKSREVYEVPGALALIMAHRELEDMTLPRGLLHFKQILEHKFADMVYNGGWYEPLMDALRAFMAETQKRVGGTVRLKFFKGSCTVAGRKSDKSLYDFGLATYGSEDAFSHDAAKGFCELYGLPLEVWAKKGK